MALTVETGSGSATADALASLSVVNAYHIARGNNEWAGTDTDKEEAIRRATAWLSSCFAWAGYRQHGRDQALAWPRVDVMDSEGWPIDPDTVPQEVADATCEAALRELVTPGFFTPDVTLSDRVRSEQVGPISVTYASTPANVSAVRPVVTRITDMLRGLVHNSSGSGGYSGRAARA